MTVNDARITVLQFRWLLARARSTAADVDVGQLTDKIVDRELMAQKALQFHLEREPAVELAIQDARTSILAQAYLEHRVRSEQIDRAATVDFYDQHPEYFRDRRAFQVFELAVIASPAQAREIATHASRAHSLVDLADWLKRSGIAFDIAGGTRYSDQLSPELLARFQAMHEGELNVVSKPTSTSVFQLVRSDLAPIEYEEALPRIEQLLLARKQTDIAQQEVKELRRHASIDYVIDLGKGHHKVQHDTAPPEPVAQLIY
jgi:peptidyl-prolyl cis-trans isomerase C